VRVEDADPVGVVSEIAEGVLVDWEDSDPAFDDGALSDNTVTPAGIEVVVIEVDGFVLDIDNTLVGVSVVGCAVDTGFGANVIPRVVELVVVPGMPKTFETGTMVNCFPAAS